MICPQSCLLNQQSNHKSYPFPNSNQLRVLAGMDAPLTQHHLNHWRTVQLETSKLLELGCVLPATNLPHFQMYRWAFVGSQYDSACDAATMNGGADIPTSATLFIPHVQRIARLMDRRFSTHSPVSGLTTRIVTDCTTSRIGSRVYRVFKK